MLAFVQVPKTKDHYGWNTMPMDRDDAIDYANEVSKNGQEAIVLRAAPVTPGLSSKELLERHESFITSDEIARFF